MSTTDDKTDPVDHSASDEAGTQEPSSKPAGPIILFFLLGLAVSLIVGWGIFPKLLYSQKRQPIDFNHALHIELVNAGCESCHFFREDGSFSGAPKLEQCTGCHAEQQGESANEKTFVTEYAARGIEVPWLVYSRQPDCVFFSHAAHVQAAKMECITCHGPIGESQQLPIYEENRITGYSRNIWGRSIAGLKENSWDRMKMDDCAACHAAQVDISEGGKTRSFEGELFANMVNILFPDSTKTGRKSSVQTNKEACFVCHQ